MELNNITQTKLAVIDSEAGSVKHFIKKSDTNFVGFGEVYFSTVKKDSIKAWKLHKSMTLNLVVPVGKVLFHFIDSRPKSKFYNQVQSFILSQDPYIRLTVPPMFWFGFKGLVDGINLISNQADLEHDPDEIERKTIDAYDVDWGIHK